MKTIFSLTAFSFFALLTFASAAKAQTTVDDKFLSGLAANKITGAWRINYAESDNPIVKMQAFVQNRTEQISAEKNNPQNENVPPMSISLVPPETLILAGEDEKSITINEGFNEIVFTKTFDTDGKTHRGELENGTDFSVTAAQTGDGLKLEIVSPRGNKMTETYSLTNEGKKLLVVVQFEIVQTKEILTLRRVYDRTTLDILPDSANEMQ